MDVLIYETCDHEQRFTDDFDMTKQIDNNRPFLFAIPKKYVVFLLRDDDDMIWWDFIFRQSHF